MSIDIKNWRIVKTQYENRVALFSPDDKSKVAVIEHYFMHESDNIELNNKILSALNNHDKLIEALKECLKDMDVMSGNVKPGSYETNGYEKAKQLLNTIQKETL